MPTHTKGIKRGKFAAFRAGVERPKPGPPCLLL